MEASPSDIGEYVFGYYRPDGTNTNMIGTALVIGTGRYNTERLYDHLDIDGKAYSNHSGEATYAEYAAKKCLDYSYGGYDDWFLPSKDEVNLMYQNLHKRGLGSFANSDYWSSSENGDYYAWKQDFVYGAEFDGNYYHRNNNLYVRAVRAF